MLLLLLAKLNGAEYHPLRMYSLTILGSNLLMASLHSSSVKEVTNYQV